jgi:pSer/pThr/pTyr-binding forkhead associated (FHA) protein
MAGALEVASFGAKFLTDEAGFRRTMTFPVLLWEAPPAKKEQPLLYATRPGQKSKRPQPGRAVFFHVEKNVMNAFADEVTLGRTANNDIAIEDNSVSRFHAYFVRTKNGWSLVDAKSSGGTWLEGKRLSSNAPELIRSGARFKVGDVNLRFLEPEELWRYLLGQLGA